jgi:hypothetical protein
MYSFLHELLSDKKGSEIFTLFGFWHFFYIALTLSTVVLLLLCLKKKDLAVKVKTAKVFGDLAFGLYIADIFLMPLAYGEIDIEKLPFHACTAMCVACFLSYRIKFLEKFRASFVILGFISNLVYLIYPAGVMWHAVHPLSYRVVQTLIFHGVMTVYGALSLIYESDNSVKLRRDLTVTVCMTLWAMLGNAIYNGKSEGYDHFFNWFFVVRDPFYLIPESISPYVMPLINIAAFFAVEMVVYLVCIKVRKSLPREGGGPHERWKEPA